jgi:serine/threonine-protein kinase RsbW
LKRIQLPLTRNDMKKENRKVTITGTGEIHKLERFIEEICDFYNINNEYFGNILLATTESANILLALNEKSEKSKVSIAFERTPKGLIFHIRMADHSVNKDRTDELLDNELRKHKLSKEIFIIRALSDEIKIAVDGRSIQLVFYVSSINYEKSLQRINKLKEYFNKTVSVIQKTDDGKH